MGRPRNIARIRALSESYSLPQYSDNDWKELEQIINCSLSAKHRDEVTNFVHRYIERTLIEQNGAETLKKIRGRRNKGQQKEKISAIMRFQEHLAGLNAVWSEMYNDDSDHRIMQEFSITTGLKTKGRFCLNRSMTELQSIAPLLTLYIQDISRPVPVTSKNHPRDVFIRGLADIIRNAGGIVSKTKPTASSKSLSPFAQFIIRLDQAFLQEAKLTINTGSDAIPQAIYRALKD